MDTMTSPVTHAVENQTPPLGDVNLFAVDRALQEALARHGGSWGQNAAAAFGAKIGGAGYQETVRKANAWLPQLHTHDRFGNRIDEIEFCDAWHELLSVAKEAGLHSLPWTDARPGAHVVRAAMHYLFGQGEQGPSCPIAMTFAAVPALRHEPDLAAEWLPRLAANRYDRRFIPAAQKTGALMGMAMTEKQGGSDVRTNSTRAVPLATGGAGEFELVGHKWFCSAPMCDAFLTLAYEDKGLSCFLVPRFLPDGTRNRFFIQRLKDKLGNKSNASSEIEYHRTWARRVGAPGRGVATILEMVHHTRLECVIGSAAILRQALTQALHHVRHRTAFQRRLIDQPLMRTLIADLCVESEAAVALMMRVARAFDEARSGGASAAFARIATPVAKYWICKRVSQAVLEALECLGGGGYVEENPMARLYREAPLNGIWEGSANVICLDVLRALERDSESRMAFLAELEAAKGADRRYDGSVAALGADLARRDLGESGARLLVERMALALAASVLLRHAPPPVADTFVHTRIERKSGLAFGALPLGTPVDALVQRVEF